MSNPASTAPAFQVTIRDALAIEAMGHAERYGLNPASINAYAAADEFLNLDGAQDMHPDDRAVVLGGVVAKQAGF